MNRHTVGPTSRNQLSFCGRAMTRTLSGSKTRADSMCSGLAHTVTGSNCAIAAATVAKACCAGTAPCLQLSGLSPMGLVLLGTAICHGITPTCRANPSTFVREVPTLLACAWWDALVFGFDLAPDALASNEWANKC